MPVFDCQNQLVTFIMPLFINVIHFRMCVLMEQKKVMKFQICVMIRIRAKERIISRLYLQTTAKARFVVTDLYFFFWIIILTRSAFAIRKVCDLSQVIGAGCYNHENAVLLLPEIKIHHIILTDAILICTAVLQQKEQHKALYWYRVQS